MFFVANQEQKQEIDTIVGVLQHGGVILYKSGSNWGRSLACLATETAAIKKILGVKYTIKDDDGFVITLDEIMQEKYVCPIPPFVKKFLQKQEGSIAVAYRKHGDISPLILHSDGTILACMISSVDVVPVQLPRHVLRLLGKPIFVTSATKSLDRGIPKTMYDIDPAILSIVDYTSSYVMKANDNDQLPLVIKYTDGGEIIVVSNHQ